ncbi:MAG TPA: pyridoxamine 5'-phosphate oxidase family protein [Solirubrobacteraceae bacterium]|nr:pyridoxamine 5'-phosphate oxidase family protein [Solirubrobacteraceae bacterium]
MTTIPDSHHDLLDAQVATLRTIDGHGFPQLTEIWFVYEDGDFKLSLNDSRLKTRNLMKRPRVGAKYGGADLREHDGPGERRVTMTIEPAMCTPST